MEVENREGDIHKKSIDIASGFPGNSLKEEDYLAHFWDCIEYAAEYFPRENAERLVELINKLEELEDTRMLVSLLTEDISAPP